MIAAIALSGAAAATGLARPQTEIVDFFSDTEGNIGVELVFIRPHLTGRTIVETRLIIDFTPAAGYDAGDLNLLLTAPVLSDPGEDGFIYLNMRDDLGWSGQGTFSAMLSFSNLNGVLQPGVWTTSMLGTGDPPLLAGAFSPATRWEIDTVPAPGAATLAALGLSAMLRRRR